MDDYLADDRNHVLAHTRGLWEELRGRRIFITGGTGFFGCWLLESFTHANDRLGLGAEAVVLTRAPAAFTRKAPHLAKNSAVRLHEGDVRDFAFPSGPFDFVLHAATESCGKLIYDDPLAMLDTIVQGTRRALDFARKCGARKFLLTSSGAVYGSQPPEVKHVSEDFSGGPDPLAPLSAYAEGKRMAEHLTLLYQQCFGIQTKIARGFAFLGPYLPLDAHFAAGNFLSDGLDDRPIRVNGDGTPFRSYLYAADLAIWLWTILFRGEPGQAYNVGCEREVTVAELARMIAGYFATGTQFCTAPRPDAKAARYVPSTRRAREELGLETWISLEEAVDRTARWHFLRRMEGKSPGALQAAGSLAGGE